MAADMFGRLFALPRARKRVLQVLTDTALIVSNVTMALFLLTGGLSFVTQPAVWLVLVPLIPLTIIIFIELGFYRQLVRYMGLKALATVLYGVTISALVMGLSQYLMDLPIPATAPVIYGILSLLTVGGIRLGFREFYHRSHSREKKRIIIYGAGQSGRQTAHSIAQGDEYAAMAFIDDNAELWGAQIAGLRVFRPSDLQALIKQYKVDALLLAIPSASRSRRAALLRDLQSLPLRIQTIPGMNEIVSGTHRVSEIMEVTVEDLLGRDPVAPIPEMMDRNIRGKVVLVTGAGGSIGSELSRQILRLRPSKLVLLDHSEFALYQIGQEITALRQSEKVHVAVVQALGSVCDGDFLCQLMAQQGVETIYHAAAYKHVPMLEENGVVGIRNNVFGTKVLVDAAVAQGVDSFTLVSTDKAVRPTNLMGASKRMAELICQAQAEGKGKTRFSIVRFGNVLGSSGSVIPKFRAQIAAGGPVTVTHPEITRYFMTIPEAAQLVIQAGAMARGRDVFVLDMGEPVKIVELAERMIRLSGFTPVIDRGTEGRKAAGADTVRIIFTQPRKGEKLFEEMFIGSVTMPTHHPRILTAMESALEPARLEEVLARLEMACAQQDSQLVSDVLQSVSAIGYAPRRALQVVSHETASAKVIPLRSVQVAAAQ